MPRREITPKQYTEDDFDLEKTKRGMSAFALAKARAKKARMILRLGRWVIMIASLAIFLLLFYFAMEVISLF